MPVFEHVSTYPQPRAEVFAWHARGGGFTRLTPPGAATVVAGPTRGIAVGSELTLRLSTPLVAGLLPDVPLPGSGKGPVGIPWTVRHVEYVEGERFVDEQVRGPLRAWRHEHEFSDAPGGGTTIVDRVTWELPVRLPGGLDAAVVEGRLRELFAFRERQLRDDLALHARLAARPAHVVVTGASGLVGAQVCALLTTGGHTVTRLTRSRRTAPGDSRWHPATGKVDEDVLAAADAVVHLAGAPIGGRFTRKHKAEVLNSRVDGTRTLARALAGPGMPTTLVQASAIGVYGPRRPGELLGEDAAPGEGFLAEVVRAWEAAAEPAVTAGVRTVFVRTGIVLSEGGGALLPQLPLFAVGLGGRLTAADAYLSWIALDDLARAYVHALFTPGLAGPVNAVAPRPVTAGAFAREVGRAMRRPALVPTPAIGPALLLGREGASELVATDQRVNAARLQGSGFVFAHPELAGALRHVLAG